MTGRAASARALDWIAIVLVAGILTALAVPWVRPEDLLIALVLVGGLRFLLRPLPIPAFHAPTVVGVATAAYALAFSFITVTRHLNLETHALDLGYYVQLVWSMANGRGPRVSLPEMHAWGDHLSPILWGLVPAFWIVPGPVTLLVAQSIALALGAPAVYLLARRRLGDERLAALFALLYLVNPSLQGMNVRDFHAAALAVPLLLWAFVAVDAGRTVLFVGALVLTLATREDAALAVMGVGLWLALGRRQWWAGAATALGAFAVLWIDLRWIIPMFRGEPYSHLARYAAFGGSLTEILAGVVLHPLRALERLATGGRIVYLLAMLAPFGFLSLLGPAELAGALPALAQNLLSRDPVLHHHRTQYQAFVLPFLVLAAIAGAARLRAAPAGALREGGPPPRRRRQPDPVLADGESVRGLSLVAGPRRSRRASGARAGARGGGRLCPGPLRAAPLPAAARLRLPQRARQVRSRAPQHRELSVAEPARGHHAPRRRRRAHHGGRGRAGPPLHGGRRGGPPPAATAPVTPGGRGGITSETMTRSRPSRLAR